MPVCSEQGVLSAAEPHLSSNACGVMRDASRSQVQAFRTHRLLYVGDERYTDQRREVAPSVHELKTPFSRETQTQNRREITYKGSGRDVHVGR